MNIISLIHRGAEGVYHGLSKFRRGHASFVLAWGDDRFDPEDFPGESLLTVPGAGQYRGLRLLRKMHTAVKLAASREGPTAISEYDAIILRGLDPSDDTLLGSRLFRSRDISADPFLADEFLHAPWVTTQAGWRKVLAEIEADGFASPEEGYPDRWLSLMALRAGMNLEATGWSENTLEISDHPAILSRRSSLRTIHGIKRPETIDLVCNTTFPT
jgi:hypothetical protein